MKSWTTCLFGGALLSAGIVADASAQSFLHERTVASAYAYDYSNYSYVVDSTMGFVTDDARSGSIGSLDGFASWSWSAPDGTWSVDFQQGNIFQQSGATVVSFFRVNQSLDIEIAWDITNINNVGGWQVFESDDLSFTPDERIDGVATLATFGTPAELIGPAGTTTVGLVPGKFYQLALELYSDLGDPSLGSGTISARLIAGSGACSPADLSSPAQPGVPDGVLTGADFFEFLNRFSAGDLSVDFSGPTTPGVPDGVLTGPDFFEFLNQFGIGC